MNTTRVVVTTGKRSEVVELDVPYEAICEEMDVAIMEAVEAQLGDDVGNHEALKVLRSDHTRTLYIVPKTIWGADGAARQIQAKHNLSDRVTKDISTTLQAFYLVGVETERQRQQETGQEE